MPTTEAEVEAQAALLAREVEADDAARAELGTATAEHDVGRLREALARMGQRGLECDQPAMEAARRRLALLEEEHAAKIDGASATRAASRSMGSSCRGNIASLGVNRRAH